MENWITRVQQYAKNLSAYLIYIAYQALMRSYRIEDVIGHSHIDQLLAEKKVFLPCYWHQRIGFCVKFLVNLIHRDLDLAFLISPSQDGEIGAKLFHWMGVRYIRGSSSSTGAQSLRDIYLAVKREKLSVASTPDGPRGPAFQFKQGWVNLSRMTDAPMLPLAYAADRFWTLKTWDSLIVPKPFAKIVVAIGEPCYANKDLDELEMEVLQHQMEDELNRLGKLAGKRLSKN